MDWDKELEITSINLDNVLEALKEEAAQLLKEGKPELAEALNKEVRDIERQRPR